MARTSLTTEMIPATTARANSFLMIVLHGLGDSMNGFRWLPSALNLPQLNYLLVNAPDDYYGGYSWYDFSGNAAMGIERSRKLLFNLIDDCIRKGFPTERIFLSGFSQGCLMTLEVGLTHPSKFAGLIGISGYINDHERLIEHFSPMAREQRVLVTHGTRDPMIPFAEVKLQMQKVKEAGINLIWKEFQKEHTIAGEEEISVIRDFIVQGF
jgi:phospholipase/carboxylesterase